MADQPSSRRRFQFRLRTLWIVVTLFCVVFAYVGSQAKIVVDRKAAMVELIRGGGGAVGTERLNLSVLEDGRDYSIPFLRRVMGDHAVFVIFYKPGTAYDEIRRLQDLFPESRIFEALQVTGVTNEERQSGVTRIVPQN
jgi:hypothetical protein